MLAVSEDRQTEVHAVLQLLLNHPGLEGWARVCMSLLTLLEGIERFMDEEDEFPHRELKQIVDRALASKDPNATLLEIATLQAFDYRVMGEQNRELWSPLEESLPQFQARHGDNIRVWRAFDAHPSRRTVERWLKTRVSESGEC